MLDRAVRLLDVEKQPGMRVRPLHLHDFAFELDLLVGIELGGEGMVGRYGERHCRQHAGGRQNPHQFPVHESCSWSSASKRATSKRASAAQGASDRYTEVYLQTARTYAPAVAHSSRSNDTAASRSSRASSTSSDPRAS